MQIELTATQQKVLAAVITAGKTPAQDFDGRAVRALASRGLVKVSATKTGKFVRATAKGKKN